jgi:hypothetical protein
MLLYSHLINFILYIGPGMGAGTIVAIIGIFTSIFLSIIAIFWYPLKRFIRFLKNKF